MNSGFIALWESIAFRSLATYTFSSARVGARLAAGAAESERGSGAPDMRFRLTASVFWYRFANYLAENFATLVGISRLPKIRFSDQEFSIACAACSGDLGVNHHTLHRWLTERQSPKKGNLALTAGFLSRVGYL